MVGFEGKIFFISLQNLAPKVGRLPMPVFYKQLRKFTSWCLVLSMKSSAVCTCCICTQWPSSYNLQTIQSLMLAWEKVGGFAMETHPLLVLNPPYFLSAPPPP